MKNKILLACIILLGIVAVWIVGSRMYCNSFALKSPQQRYVQNQKRIMRSTGVTTFDDLPSKGSLFADVLPTPFYVHADYNAFYKRCLHQAGVK